MEFSNWGSVPLKSELEIRNCILEESLEKLKNTAIERIATLKMNMIKQIKAGNGQPSESIAGIDTYTSRTINTVTGCSDYKRFISVPFRGSGIASNKCRCLNLLFQRYIVLQRRELDQRIRQLARLKRTNESYTICSRMSWSKKRIKLNENAIKKYVSLINYIALAHFLRTVTTVK